MADIEPLPKTVVSQRKKLSRQRREENVERAKQEAKPIARRPIDIKSAPTITLTEDIGEFARTSWLNGVIKTT
jgi:hypothetical protein